MRIALLGDSTLDNGAYTDGGADVVTHLNALLTGGDRATLFALDGAVGRHPRSSLRASTAP